MTSATIEQDALVSQPTREKVFTARREDLRLVLIPEYPILNAQGAKTGQNSEGLTVRFVNGLLRLPLEGTIRTENGREVDVAEVWPFINKHRLLGDRFEGFVELTISAPPVSADELRALTRASLALNEEALQDLIEQETEGWNREDILGPAREALDGIRALKADAKAQEAEKAAKPAKSAPKA